MRLELSETGHGRVHRSGGDLLLDATRAPLGSALQTLGRDVSSIERLSHCLFWSDGSSVELIEMPRLQLRFRFRTGLAFDGKGAASLLCFKKKLYCEAYGGQEESSLRENSHIVFLL